MYAANVNVSDIFQSDTDAALARALLASDPRAFGQAFRRFSPVVKRRLRRAFGSDSEVEDVAQEVFLSVFRGIHGLREPEALSSFVLTITRRAVSRELRRRRARSYLKLEADLENLSSIGVRDAAAHHAFVHLVFVLERLKERERRAFVLRFVERREAEEIADALGVSVSTARRCFVRAWKRVAFFADRNRFLSDYLAESAVSTRPGEPAQSGLVGR